MHGTLYLSETDVKSCLPVGSLRRAVEVVEKGISALGRDDAVQPEKIYLRLPGAAFVKPMIAHLRSDRIIATKLFTFFPENPSKYGLPTVHASILLTDVENGVPYAFMGGNWITQIRTAAATTIAAKYLARKNAQSFGVIGAGMQARSHLMTLKEYFPLSNVIIFDKSETAAGSYAEWAEKEMEIHAETASTPPEVARRSDITLLATTDNAPLIHAQDLSEGAFVAKIGSYQELEEVILSTVDRLVVDWWPYVSERVLEVKRCLESGLISRERIVELHELVVGGKPGRMGDREKALFVSIGMGVEDAALAQFVYDRAREMNLGTTLAS